MGRITETPVIVAIVAIVTVKVGGETNTSPLTLMHGLSKREVNLALMGLRLRKYI